MMKNHIVQSYKIYIQKKNDTVDILPNLNSIVFVANSCIQTANQTEIKYKLFFPRENKITKCFCLVSSAQNRHHRECFGWPSSSQDRFLAD